MRAIDLTSGTEIVPPERCLELLRTEEIGRLGVVRDGEVDIFPVNYEMDGDLICFTSNWGRKLLGVVNAEATFEVDSIDRQSRCGWSVIVHGVLADVTPRRDDDPGLPRPWTGPKDYKVRIRPTRMTGRQIQASFWEGPK